MIGHLELAWSNQTAVTQGKRAAKIRIRGVLHVQETEPSGQATLTQAPAEFTPKIHHNDKPFLVCFLEEAPKATECRKCKTGFIRTKIIPFDIVLSHEERWMYPDPKDRSKWLPSASTTVKYYCVRKSCVVDRFPYFNASFVLPSTKDKLLTSHVKILKEELGYCASW